LDCSLPPFEARISAATFSISFSRACNESYEPSWIRLAMVAGPVGGVNLVRFESASPDELRVIEEVMVCVSIEGWVS
jgi:hypothetical protein